MLNDFIHMTPSELFEEYWWVVGAAGFLLFLALRLVRAITWVRTFVILWRRNWKIRRKITNKSTTLTLKDKDDSETVITVSGALHVRPGEKVALKYPGESGPVVECTAVEESIINDWPPPEDFRRLYLQDWKPEHIGEESHHQKRRGRESR